MSDTHFIKSKQKAAAGRRAAFAVILLLSFVFLYISPRFFLPRLDLDPYSEWNEHKKEPPVDVFKVWHVMGIRPYAGSLGNWLSKRAKEYSKDLIGIYFEIETLTYEAAEEKLKRGISPDIISFSSGMFSKEIFLSDRIPSAFCASGRVLLYDPTAVSDGFDELTANAQSPEAFKKGKCASCICDVRTAGDLQRAQLLGNCPYFEAVPMEEPPVFQYIGITRMTDQVKRPYAEGFIDHILDVERQSSLCEIGLMPVDPEADAEYDTEWLSALYAAIRQYEIPYCF